MVARPDPASSLRRELEDGAGVVVVEIALDMVVVHLVRVRSGVALARLPGRLECRDRPGADGVRARVGPDAMGVRKPLHPRYAC